MLRYLACCARPPTTWLGCVSPTGQPSVFALCSRISLPRAQWWRRTSGGGIAFFAPEDGGTLLWTIACKFVSNGKCPTNLCCCERLCLPNNGTSHQYDRACVEAHEEVNIYLCHFGRRLLSCHVEAVPRPRSYSHLQAGWSLARIFIRAQ